MVQETTRLACCPMTSAQQNADGQHFVKTSSKPLSACLVKQILLYVELIQWLCRSLHKQESSALPQSLTALSNVPQRRYLRFESQVYPATGDAPPVHADRHRADDAALCE